VRGNHDTHDHALIAKLGAIACAIPIAHVVEIMRPLPVEAIGHAPAFVRGLAVIRGAPTPVVDTARLLGVAGEVTRRYVVVRAGARTVALAFDDVVDVRPIARAELAALPPLVRGATAEAAAALAVSDAGLLVLLEAARAIPPELWRSLERGAR